MDDNEFDVDFESAWREAINDPGREPDLDPTDIALEVHADRLEARQAYLCTRGSVTEDEIKEVEARRQAYAAYMVLMAVECCERGLTMLSKTDPSKLSDEKKIQRAETLTELYETLLPLDDLEPLARQILSGLGLPTTIDEFEDFDGNKCRINLNLASCKLAPAELFDKFLKFYYGIEDR